MRKSTSIILLLIFPLFLMSCSKDDATAESVMGTWELTSWSVDIPMDLNNDAIESENLLNEATCANNETLLFEPNGTVSSNSTYNPQVNVSLENGTEDRYIFNVVCDTEGVIGTIGAYSQNNNIITLFDSMGVIDGNRLTVVYENAIDIYNEDFTEIIDSKNLTLVYMRK